MTWPRVIGVFLVLCLGYVLGHSNAEVVTKKVEVPVYKTQIKTVHETVTVDNTKPVPESCTDLPSYADKVNDADGILTKASGEIKLALSDMGRAAYSGDVTRINEATETINKNKDAIDAAAVARAEASSDLDSALSRCEKEVNE